MRRASYDYSMFHPVRNVLAIGAKGDAAVGLLIDVAELHV